MWPWSKRREQIEEYVSAFKTSDRFICEYTRGDFDYGELTRISIPGYSLEIAIYCSVRRGVQVKIKRLKPYKILVDYNDGAFIWDEDKVDICIQLKDKIDKIRKMKDDSKINQGKVEDAVYEYVLSYLELE